MTNIEEVNGTPSRSGRGRTTHAPHWFLASALLLALGCAKPLPSESHQASPQSPRQEAPLWKVEAARAAGGISTAAGTVGKGAGIVTEKAGAAAGIAAKGMGNSLSTAFRGVSNGFEESKSNADYGKPPARYIDRIRAHFSHFMRIPSDSSFKFGKPERGYINQGILRGGEVAWRGYLVDVAVAPKPGLLESGKPRHYVVRMRDGEIVEVHKKDRASALQRVSSR